MIGEVNLENCIFVGNSAYYEGPVIRLTQDVHCFIRNCTFSENRVADGDLVVMNSEQRNSIYIINSILFEGRESENKQFDPSMKIRYSCGNLAGEGNIQLDPLFVSPGY